MKPFDYLGPYRVDDPIGRGGMGSVFRATHEKTGDVVAVKVISSTVADDMRFRRRFASEVESLKKLKHPNIVTLIGYGEQQGHLFYSMELVDGESLQQRLRREKRLAWPWVLEMAISICGALKHAHDFGIIHRDLKPANLLLCGDNTVKLVDFGIAKLFGSTEQTAAGSVLGTADFMAPEQACDGPITPRTDLYALGNVLYACFAGRAPFSGRSMTHVVEALRQEQPAPLEAIAPDVPIEIVLLIHDLLEKSPADRPPTALSVMNRMKAIRAGLQREGGRGDHPTVLEDDGEVIAGQKTARPFVDMKTDLAAGKAGSTELSTGGPKSGPRQQSQPTVASLPAAESPRRERVGEPTVATSDVVSAAAGSTHFSTIAERERKRGTLEANEAAQDQTPWGPVLSIVGMVGVLAIAAGVLFWATRRPSADELYRSVLRQRDQGNATVAKALIDQFSRLYPDDDRNEELSGFLGEIDSDRVIRQLRIAALREGGTDRLQPDEEALLDAIRDRDRDPAKTQRLLSQWIDVYGQPGSPEGISSTLYSRTALVQTARIELARLQGRAAAPLDARADDLIFRMRWAEKNLARDEQVKLLEGLISLFEGKPWATPAIEFARTQLQAVDSPLPGEDQADGNARD